MRDFVLVVEDDGDVRETIAEVIGLEGWAVVCVENGEQALGALAAAEPAMILTDLAMPIRDGVELIAIVRRDSRLQDIPICVISAELQRAPAGTQQLAKPFEVGELLRVLREHLPVSCRRRRCRASCSGSPCRCTTARSGARSSRTC